MVLITTPHGEQRKSFMRLVQFTTNNLHLIEDMGYEQVEAFVWHQGDRIVIVQYVADLEDLVGSFRELPRLC